MNYTGKVLLHMYGFPPISGVVIYVTPQIRNVVTLTTYKSTFPGIIKSYHMYSNHKKKK